MEILPRATARRIANVYKADLRLRVEDDDLWPDEVSVYINGHYLIICITVTSTMLDRRGGRRVYYRAFQTTREHAAGLVDVPRIRLIAKPRNGRLRRTEQIADTQLRSHRKDDAWQGTQPTS